MKKRDSIHTTLTPNAERELSAHSETTGKSKGAILSELLEGARGPKTTVVEVYAPLPAPDEKIVIEDDPICRLQGGIFKNSFILVSGGTGTGKTTILLNIAAEISLNKSVLFITPEDENKIKKGLEAILYRKNRVKGKTSLHLKVAKVSSISDLTDIIDTYNNAAPLFLFVDPLNGIKDLDFSNFNIDAWQLFIKYVRRPRKITMIATVAAVAPEKIIDNSILGCDSIFYLTQTPVLMDGKSRLARYIITFKSPRGTIPPTEFLLLENWQIRLVGKNPILNKPVEQLTS